MSSNLKITKVCQWCGKEFIARTTATGFCSHRCSNFAYKEKKRQKRLQEFQEEYARVKPGSSTEIEKQEFLTPVQLSKLLGMCRASIYNYISLGVIKPLRLRGKTLIRRKDIEDLFDTPPTLEAVLITKNEKKPIKEFYTNKEILEKFGLSNSGFYKIAQTQNFPKTTSRGKTLWSKIHIDRYFEKRNAYEDITEWYTVAEIQEKFGMTLSAIYCLVSKEGIPKIKVGIEARYSKKHFDIAKGIADPEPPQEYTIAEAMQKFGMTRDQLYHYVKTYKIPREKRGKYTYISRKELDDLLAPPVI